MKTPFLITLALVAMPLGHAHAIDTVTEEPPPEPWIADYEGTEIDLRFGWDAARACQTDGIETVCYDSEAEMIAALDAAAAASAAAAPAGSSGLLRASCSSFLRLYTGTNYTGSVLALTTQYTYLNLSSYGFNNVTSSYRVGACPSYFFDLTNGGAPQYTGPTSAGTQSPTMLAGWDNRVSSFYIG
ncbi:MAG: hypothetical protein NTZ21_04570 [Actinobacteria bacterium]|nr:hypothetical protein [Actinomycetota bacterium]